MNEIGSAIEEAVNRKSDARLRSEINTIFKDFTERLTKLYERYDATAPGGIDLREFQEQAFAATCPGARLRAAESVIRELSQEAGDRG